MTFPPKFNKGTRAYKPSTAMFIDRRRVTAFDSAPTSAQQGIDVSRQSVVLLSVTTETAVAAAPDGWTVDIIVWRLKREPNNTLINPSGVWFCREHLTVALDGDPANGPQEIVLPTLNSEQIFYQVVSWTADDPGDLPDTMELILVTTQIAPRNERTGEDCCPAAGDVTTVNVNEDPRPEPDERVLHDGDEIAGPDPLDYPATVYFPDVNGIDIRDGADDERRNVALYLEILAAPSNHADSEVTVTMEEDIAGLGDWVNMSAAGYSIINDVRGVTEWTNVTATDDPLEDRVDWDGVRSHRVRVRVDTGSIADEARLVISLSEEN